MSTWYEWRDAPAADYAVIGDPIAHSWSPKLHETAYRALGLDECYVAIRVPHDEFETALEHLASLGYRGLNVTIPLKEAAFAWARDIDPESTPYRALNTLSLADRRGTNTDAPGFLDMLTSLGFGSPPHAVRGKFTATKERVTQGESYPERAQEVLASPQGAASSGQEVLNCPPGHSGPHPLTPSPPEWRGGTGCALILGAGGTARTLAMALLAKGVRVAMWNRTKTRAEQLAEEIPGLIVVDAPVANGFQLVINATAAGLSGESPQVDWAGAPLSCAGQTLHAPSSVAEERGGGRGDAEALQTRALAIDAVYANAPTPFMRAARDHGFEAHDGRLMLVAQAARAFAWWHGVNLPYEAMLRALED